MSIFNNICAYGLFPFSIILNVLLYWRVRIEVWYGDNMKKLYEDTMDGWHRSDKEWRKLAKEILSNNKDNIDYDA